MSAAIRTKSTAFLRRVALPSFRYAAVASAFSGGRSISTTGVRFAAAPSSVSGKKGSARLSHVQQLLLGSEDHADESQTPQIRLEHEKNRINKDGEIVVSSRRTLTQQGNIQHCLSKLQAIIDAAAYVPPPPSEDQKKIITQLAELSELKRLQNKKACEQLKLI